MFRYTGSRRNRVFVRRSDASELPIKRFMLPSVRRAPPRFDFQIAKDYDPFSTTAESSGTNVVAWRAARGSCPRGSSTLCQPRRPETVTCAR